MSDHKYPPGGALFPKTNKPSPRAPDFDGYVEFDQSHLEEIKGQIEATGRAKMDLAAWRKMSSNGEFLSIRCSPPYRPERKQERPAPKSESPFDTPPPKPDLDDEIPF